MTDRLPFTIEILGFDEPVPVVLDRVIGGSVYLDEAKRIGHHLLSLVENGTRPLGYCVLSHDQESVYTWRRGDNASPADQMLRKLQDLEETAAKLLEAARKLAPGLERHSILKEIGIFRVKIAELKVQGNDATLAQSRRKPRPNRIRQ
jgi:hypothetical protein